MSHVLERGGTTDVLVEVKAKFWFNVDHSIKNTDPQWGEPIRTHTHTAHSDHDGKVMGIDT